MLIFEWCFPGEKQKRKKLNIKSDYFRRYDSQQFYFLSKVSYPPNLLHQAYTTSKSENVFLKTLIYFIFCGKS